LRREKAKHWKESGELMIETGLNPEDITGKIK
jgi:hypothetical protein